MLNDEEIKKLLEVARETRENAFSFRSGHAIGACVLTTDGQYFGGCNTEGVISSLGVCAEMSAMDHAVVHGKYEFKAVGVVDEVMTYPCGACLQYLTQFFQTTELDVVIVAADVKGNYEIKMLSELLPNKFASKSLDEKIKGYKNKV